MKGNYAWSMCCHSHKTGYNCLDLTEDMFVLIYPVPGYLLSATTFTIITTIATASTSFISFPSDLTIYSSKTICVYITATQGNSLCFCGKLPQVWGTSEMSRYC